MPGQWIGKRWIGSGSAYFIGDAIDNDLHAHYVLQIAIAISGELMVSDDANHVHMAQGVIIPSGKRHCIMTKPGSASEIIMLFIEPCSTMGRLIKKQLQHGLSEIIDIEKDRLDKILSVFAECKSLTGEPLVLQVVSVLTDHALRHQPIDRRVAFALDFIGNHLIDTDSIEHVAERLSITPRYLRKLFEQEIGLSPQRYRLWCKLRAALTNVLSGESLTNAAANAGFADSAHFSRTFRDMFGSSPSKVFNGNAAGKKPAEPITLQHTQRLIGDMKTGSDSLV